MTDGAPTKIRVIQIPTVSFTEANPYVALLDKGLRATNKIELLGTRMDKIRRAECDIVHFHWPEHFVSTGKGIDRVRNTFRVFLSFALGYRRGVRFVWTVHNLEPHRRHRLWTAKFAYWLATRYVSSAIFMSNSSKAEAERVGLRFRKAKKFVIPHGHYRDSYPLTSKSKDEAREALGVATGGKVLLCLGQVRSNKNLAEFAAAFTQAAPEPDRLLIAGHVHDHEEAEQLIRLAAGDTRIKLELEKVPADLVTTYLRAADVMVVPYSIPNSGVLLLALSFAVPSVTPSSDAVEEMSETSNFESFVHGIPGDLTDLATAALLLGPVNEQPNLSSLEWNLIGQSTVATYEDALKQASNQK